MTAGSAKCAATCSGSARPGSGRCLATALALFLVFQPVLPARSSRDLHVLPRGPLRRRSSGAPSGSASIRGDVAHGLVRMEMPGKQGAYEPCAVALAMIGAVGGSLMNLAYPYFLDAKGWRGPQYRRVQIYDFLLAVTAMIVLNLAVWVLGAELLFPDGTSRTSTICRPAERRARRGRTAALLPRHLRRDLHVDPRPRGRPRVPRHPRLAPVASANPAPIAPDFRRAPLLSAGLSSGASSHRWSGRCPACPTSLR